MFALYILTIITSCSFSGQKNDIYTLVKQVVSVSQYDKSHPTNHHQRPNSATTVPRIILIMFSSDKLHAYLQ